MLDFLLPAQRIACSVVDCISNTVPTCHHLCFAKHVNRQTFMFYLDHDVVRYKAWFYVDAFLVLLLLYVCGETPS